MEHVNLKSLIFNSYDDDAELFIEVRKESLSYSTTYLIPVLDVNRILNYLQKNNLGQDLNECIEATDYSDFKEYSLMVNKLTNRTLNKQVLEFLSINRFKKQIRA